MVGSRRDDGHGLLSASMTDVGVSSRELWLRAGQTLLRRGGPSTVKLQALTDELGLTTGSFYHHFTGMAGYLDELARYYGIEQPAQSRLIIDDPDPLVRLRNLDAFSRGDRMQALDAAMRDWAATSPVAAEAVRAADASLLRFVEQAFADLGFVRAEARTRALLLVSAGVARVHPPWALPRDVFERALKALVAPA
jgi:AcrR family transcriptional regulator